MSTKGWLIGQGDVDINGPATVPSPKDGPRGLAGLLPGWGSDTPPAGIGPDVVGSRLVWLIGNLTKLLAIQGWKLIRQGHTSTQPAAFAWEVISEAAAVALDSTDLASYAAKLDWDFRNVELARSCVLAWQRYLSAVAKDEYPSLIGLTALRETLILFAAAEHKLVKSGTSEAVIEGAAMPEAFGVGGGVKASNKIAKSTELGLGLKCFIVPVIEVIDRCIRFVLPLDGIAPAEAVAMWDRGQLPEGLAQNIAALGGAEWDDVRQLTALQTERMPVEQLIEFARRAGKDANWLDDQLRQRGVTLQDQRDIAKLLYDEIPPITDLLRFAQRNVTVDAVVQSFGLSDEFDRFWQGQLKSGLEASGVSKEWAELYWRAHWVTASVATGQEALRRLRPGRVPKELEFTRDNLANLFRENDILPFWRDRLVALAYNPPGIRFIRSLYAERVTNDAKAMEQLQDIGYSHDDAKDLTTSLRIERARTLASQGHGYTVAEIAKLYKEYAFLPPDVRKWMTALGYYDEDSARLMDRVDDERLGEQRVALIGFAHHGYTHGVYNRDQAQARLLVIGLPPNHVDQVMIKWKAELDSMKHVGTLAEVVGWYKHGLLSVSDLADRLTAFGYTHEDFLRVITMTNQDLAAKVQAARLAQAKALQAAQVKAAAQLKAAQDKAHAEFIAHNKRLAGVMNADEEAALLLTLAKIQASLDIALGQTTDKAQQGADKAQAGLQKAKVKAPVKPRQARRKLIVEEGGLPH